MVDELNDNKLSAKNAWAKLGRNRPNSASNNDKNSILKPQRQNSSMVLDYLQGKQKANM